MILEIGKIYLTRDQTPIKIAMHSKANNTFKGMNLLTNKSYGFWRENGVFNTYLDERKIVKEITKEEYPEYFL